MNENVEAFEMPSNLNDYTQHLTPEMVAQGHEQAAQYIPSAAH
jgi:hypothetical protein